MSSAETAEGAEKWGVLSPPLRASAVYGRQYFTDCLTAFAHLCHTLHLHNMKLAAGALMSDGFDE